MRRERYDHTHPELPKDIHLEIPGHLDRLKRSRWVVGGYLAPTLVVLYTIFWVLMSYWLIGVRGRDWEYGTAPYVPAESYFTSSLHTSGPAPRQVTLPSGTILGAQHPMR